MPYPSPTHFSLAGNRGPSSSSSELRITNKGRDSNVNVGPGTFNVNNHTSLIRQPQPMRWQIQGTDEEEEEECDQVSDGVASSYSTGSLYGSSLAENNPSSPSNSELRIVHTKRNQVINNGSGTITIINDSRVINHARSTQRHAQGTEEEEVEYERWLSLAALMAHGSRIYQYTEYKRCEVQPLELIHREKVWDQTTSQFVGCERSIWLGEIVSGNEKGTIVTIECYQGQDAPKKWKHALERYSVDLNSFLKPSRSTSNAHLLGLTRSKIPLLIFLDELVPAAVFAKNVGKLGEYYLASLYIHWGCHPTSGSDELWMNMKKGVICRGPRGPSTNVLAYGIEEMIEDPLPTADLLKEEFLIRYLATFVPESVDRPTVFYTLSNTPIAVGNNVWTVRHAPLADSWDEDSLIEQQSLGNGWTRFRLNNHTGGSLWLELNAEAREAWVSEALSIFHALEISLEGDLSAYKLVMPTAEFYGDLLSDSSKLHRRQRQPIYLFFCPPNKLPDEGNYSFFHCWSLTTSGHPPLSRRDCQIFGLPFEVRLRKSLESFSWSTNHYKSLCEYQVLRGFDPTTTEFARHVKYYQVFCHPDDSERLEMPDEGFLAGHESCPDTVDSGRSSPIQEVDDSSSSISDLEDIFMVSDLVETKLPRSRAIERIKHWRVQAERDYHHDVNYTENGQDIEEPNIQLSVESSMTSLSYGSVSNVNLSLDCHNGHCITHPNQQSNSSSTLPNTTSIDMSFRVDDKPSNASTPQQKIGIDPLQVQTTVSSSMNLTLPQWNTWRSPSTVNDNNYNSDSLLASDSIGFANNIDRANIANTRNGEIYFDTSISSPGIDISDNYTEEPWPVMAEPEEGVSISSRPDIDELCVLFGRLTIV
ncbi:hypothetical protein PQX77_021187 [Marasmius sp. AFHP31]|nr:hypothetical protein PQX77_021187 [Marasmius sp. AFHP31]